MNCWGVLASGGSFRYLSIRCRMLWRDPTQLRFSFLGLTYPTSGQRRPTSTVETSEPRAAGVHIVLLPTLNHFPIPTDSTLKKKDILDIKNIYGSYQGPVYHIQKHRPVLKHAKPVELRRSIRAARCVWNLRSSWHYVSQSRKQYQFSIHRL